MLKKNKDLNNSSGARILVTSKENAADSYAVYEIEQTLIRNLKNLNLNNDYRILITISIQSSNISYAPNTTVNRSINAIILDIEISKNHELCYENKIIEKTTFAESESDEFTNKSANTGAINRLIQIACEKAVVDIKGFSNSR